MWSMIHFSHFESIEVGSLLELKQCLHWEKKQLSPLGVSKRSKTPSNTLLEYISLKYHAVLGHPGILRGKNMVDSYTIKLLRWSNCSGFGHLSKPARASTFEGINIFKQGVFVL